MENLISHCSEEQLIQFVLNGNQPLSVYIRELEKIQAAVTLKIQNLAFNYHESILNHQTSIVDLGSDIKNTLKKAVLLQERTTKLGNELQTNLIKMNEGIEKLEKVQQAEEIVKLAQQFFMKTKKLRPADSKELEEIAEKLKGITVIDKIFRNK